MRRLLVIGCGDVGLRAVICLRGRRRVYALTHNPDRATLLREHGITPIIGNLDDASSLEGLAGLAHDVLHCAPPLNSSVRDTRTAHLIAALAKGKSLPQRLVYISTSGVYGDCAGALIDETRAVRPRTERAMRRVDAERILRAWGKRSGVQVCVLRAPGIYSAQRLPLPRLRAGTPALNDNDDAYTNHIHAEDLARMAVAAMRLGYPGRLYNASDDTRLRMGEYFDLVADAFGLPRPPRIARAEAAAKIPSAMLSFMSESRQLSNRRIKQELRFALRFPTVRDGMAAARAQVA